jgi:hypothetical protein
LIGAKYPRCINEARHEEITEWIGRKFDPEAFGLTMTNQILRQLALHVALVIVVDPNRKDHRKPDFVGEVSPFFPLCIYEGSFCSMPNHERGTVAVTRQALGAANPQVLREQFKHLR